MSSVTDSPFGTLTPSGYQAHLRREADAFRAAVATGPPEAAVAACPGWNVRSLVDHLGRIHQWATAIVRGSGPDHRAAELPADADPVGWYATQVDRLAETLATADPEAPCWTFHPQQKVAAFWSRRQAHEVAVHRMDAELAVGGASAYDPDLAVDGVGELLDVMVPRVSQRSGPPDLAAPVLLTCTDRPARWLLRPDSQSVAGGVPVADGPAVTDSDASSAAATLQGPAAGLLLMLWKRPLPPGVEVTVSGDATVVRRLLASRLTP